MDSASSRRARMQVRVYRSFADHERDDPGYWRALPIEVRVLES
jgi:hypothetical protein